MFHISLNSVADPISKPALNFLLFLFLLFVFRWTAEDRPTSHQPTGSKSKPVPREIFGGISVLITVQRDATQSSLFIILEVHSTYFGCQPHPSSGLHKTVTTASGTGHIFLYSYLPPTLPSLATLEGGSCTKFMTSTGGSSYSFVYSSWWVWLTPETCRVNLQNNK